MNFLKKILLENFNVNDERNKFKLIMQKFPNNSSILEIGCGLGRNLDFLSGLGFKNVTGMDINKELVNQAQSFGYKAFHLEETVKWEGEYDILIFSHIIEHFGHSELKDFLENYLEQCKDNGNVIILTPVFTRSFYNDFDHVKPYLPIGIEMVFGEQLQQVKYDSKYNLDILNFFFYRDQFRLRYFRSLALRKKGVPSFINGILKVIFNLTGGLFGEVVGWIGSFQVNKKSI